VTTSRSATATHAAAGALLVVAAAALFGTIGTARALGPDAPALPVAAARSALACLLLAAVPLWMAWRQGTGRELSVPAGVRVALRTRAVWTAALGQAAFQWCFLAAVPRVGVAVGTLVAIGLTPVVTGVLSRHVDRIWAAGHRHRSHRPDAPGRLQPVRNTAGLLLAVGAAIMYGVYLFPAPASQRPTPGHDLGQDHPWRSVLLDRPIGHAGAGPRYSDHGAGCPPRSGSTMTVYLAVLPTPGRHHLLGTGAAVCCCSTASTSA
jgi:hypothetical protein